MVESMFITKYALTKGIIEVSKDKARQSTYDQKFFHVDGYYNGFTLGTNIFYSREEAVKVAEQMRDKRIKGVQKQLNELQKMTF